MVPSTSGNIFEPESLFNLFPRNFSLNSAITKEKIAAKQTKPVFCIALNSLLQLFTSKSIVSTAFMKVLFLEISNCCCLKLLIDELLIETMNIHLYPYLVFYIIKIIFQLLDLEIFYVITIM